MTETTGTATVGRRAGSATPWGVACAAGAAGSVAAVLWQAGQPASPGAVLLAVAASVLLVAGPVGLLRAGAAGADRVGRAGLVAAAAGWLVLTVAEVVGFAVGTDPVALYAASTGLVFLGMLAAGVAVLRAGRWQGWRRGVPLLCALWVLAVSWLFGREDLLGVLGLVTWLLTWVVLGAALLGRPAATGGTR